MARELVVKLIGDDASLQRAFTRSSRNSKTFERDIGRASRGALAGSGVFRGLGRSIAFASGGFLAFASAGQFLRTSIDAAKEAAVTQAQLAAQFRASGKDLGTYQKAIDETTSRLSALSGFQDDELKAGFTTIFRTTGNVAKGLRDIGIAADLARAKHIGLAQASLIVAKTEAGNTTLLRRQGFQIGKNVKSEEALAILRRAVAGQARAGSTEQERFGAVLHRTEEIIGTGLLPTLNKYLASGGKWLEQMNESGDLQRKVASAADTFASAVGGVVSVVKTADKVTGSFKNTLELLAGLKVASSLAGMASNFGLIGRNAKTAEGEVAGLRGSLSKLALIGAIVIPIEIAIHRKQVDDVGRALQKRFVDAQKNFKPVQLLAKGEAGAANAPGIKQALGLIGVHNVTAASLLEPIKGLPAASEKAATAIRLSAAKVAKETTDFGVHVARSIKDAQTTTIARSEFTSVQRNTFFDNSIARILLRGGLGSIGEQITALQKANGLIAARLKVTKDVTRKLNLEDELLQNQAQIKTLRGQQASDRVQLLADRAQKALEARDKAHQKAVDALARRVRQRNASQFTALGLTAEGETRAASVKQLRNAFGDLSKGLQGTFLDTSKTESILKNVRRVLSGQLGAVGRDVRLKVQGILGDLNQQLRDHSRTLTKFGHINSQAIVNAVGGDLSPEQLRRLRAVVSTIGAGGNVPRGRSAAFSGGGATYTGDIHIHGVQNVSQIEAELRKRAARRHVSKRGPYAGNH